MNKILSLFFATACTLGFMACSDTFEATPNKPYQVTADTLPLPNASLLEVKQQFAAAIEGRNTFELVQKDIIFEGVVVGNDLSGNLYQTLLVRQIASTADAPDDQCIVLGVKHTALFPYFALGQRIRVNLNGLYVGNYSKTPKVGKPYYTSAGNLRLGPILFEDLRHNVQLIGKPNPAAPELTPIDLTTTAKQEWLAQRSNQTYLHTPLLATVSGSIDEMQGAKAQQAEVGKLSQKAEPLPKVFAPKVLYDAGYGVNRTLLLSNGVHVDLRTATRNKISFLPLPATVKRYTGMVSYFSNWQLQLRTPEDIQ